MVTPISQMRKQRDREGQGQAQLYSQGVAGLSGNCISESQSWTPSLTAAASSKHDLGRPRDKTEPEAAHLVWPHARPCSALGFHDSEVPFSI